VGGVVSSPGSKFIPRAFSVFNISSRRSGPIGCSGRVAVQPAGVPLVIDLILTLTSAGGGGMWLRL